MGRRPQSFLGGCSSEAPQPGTRARGRPCPPADTWGQRHRPASPQPGSDAAEGVLSARRGPQGWEAECVSAQWVRSGVTDMDLFMRCFILQRN